MADNEKQVLSKEDIAKVKALGFLNCKGTDCFNCRVITGNGKITSEQTRRIAEAADQFGNGEIAMTARLTIEIQSVPYEHIDELIAFLKEGGLQTGGTGAKIRPVVSCKGTTCQYGLYDTFSIAQKIHEKFYEGYHDVKLPHKFKIAVGGCPNNCIKPDLNDFGIVGQRIVHFDGDKCKGCKKCFVEEACPIGAVKLSDGKIIADEALCNKCGRCVEKCPFQVNQKSDNGFKVYIGGRWGKKIARGRALGRIFTSEEELLDVLEKAILLFKEQGIAGERFADTIERLGFENVEKQLLHE